MKALTKIAFNLSKASLAFNLSKASLAFNVIAKSEHIIFFFALLIKSVKSATI